MSPLRHHLQAFLRVEPGRPAYGAGLRAALAVGGPMAVAALLHLPAATWVGLAALFVALVDRGGPYRDRALTMGAMTLLGAGVGLVAALHLPAWAAVIVTLLWVTACGFARSYGDTPGLLGVVLANYFVVSLALPARDVADALLRSGLFLVGGAWAMFLALMLWPLVPYRPARLAIARCFDALADHAEEVGRWPLEGGPPAAAGVLPVVAPWQARMRQLIEQARTVLASTRMGRAGESGRGEHLLVLVEGVDSMMVTLIALTEMLEVAPAEPRYHPLRAEVRRALAALAADLRRVTLALEKGTAVDPQPVWDAERVKRALEALETAGEVPEPVRAGYQYVYALLDRLRDYAHATVEVAARLEGSAPVPDALALPVRRAEPAPRQALLEPLRENLNVRSVIFRHALRLGVAAALATALVWALGLNHGYWVIITVTVVLQPYAGLTFQRSLQRIAGTLLGAALAAGLVALVREPAIILLAIVVLFAVAMSVQPLSLSAFQVLLTPALVLLAELQSGDWELAGVRIINTLLGGLIALTVTRLLWPSPEHLRLPEQVAFALRADRDYLKSVAAAHSDAEPAVREARRKMGLALLAAEASFQRLLGEWRGPARDLEPLMALLVYARRFTSAVTTLAASRADPASPRELSEVVRFAGGVLDELATAMEQQRRPAPMPATAPAGGVDALSRAHVERLVRQLTVLHSAAERVPPLRLKEGVRSGPASPPAAAGPR
ncbi:FUSC family protein [Myxococcus sp. SDU36]|uniref:FUSC family protein n=1 Tax=Myxococcus sp. SDU36 TaxID=2831967 RepID=UPI002542BD7E|nr:FUSC family protein [Myxococcus sp. SDU36]WIG95375.1 FUSC family protein [Myxococcus sp. SDU36]